MKSVYLLMCSLLFVGIIFQSCNENEVSGFQETVLLKKEEFFKKNMAVFDARIRSIDDSKYVRELYLPNFSNDTWGEDEIGFDGEVFIDNGEINDQAPNDGIFTSVNTFNHDSRIPYFEDKKLRSVLSKVIVSPDFIQDEALNELELNYDLRKGQIQSRVLRVTCDIVFRDCPNEYWYNTTIFGEPCVYLEECSVTFGF